VRGTGEVDGERFAVYTLRAGRFEFEQMLR
jgi:hypothetical protein